MRRGPLSSARVVDPGIELTGSFAGLAGGGFMSASAFSADDDLSVASAVFEPQHFDDDAEPHLDDDEADQDQHAAKETAGQQRAVTPNDDQPTTSSVVLYTPSTAPDSREIRLALKPLEDGRLALLVFTSLDLLVSGCGNEQPWVAISETQLEELFHTSGADVVVVDAGLTPQQRWGEGNEPQTLQQFRSERDVSEQEA